MDHYEFGEGSVEAACENLREILEEQDVKPTHVAVIDLAQSLRNSREDPELGAGNEKKFNFTMAHAAMAIEAYDAHETLLLFCRLNIQYEPEILRFFSRVGQTVCKKACCNGPAMTQKATKEMN